MNEPAPDSGDNSHSGRSDRDRDLLFCREDRSLLPVSPPSSVTDIVDWTAQLKLLTPCHHQPPLLVLESPPKDCFCTPKDHHPVPDRDRRHKSYDHKQDEFQVEDTKPEQYLYGIYPYLFDDYDWKYMLQSRPPYHPIDYAFVQQQVNVFFCRTSLDCHFAHTLIFMVFPKRQNDNQEIVNLIDTRG